MKKLLTTVLMTVLTVTVISFSSCKGKPKDADIKAAIETALKADPMAANTMVSVDKGIATITGVCKDDACKTHCADLVKGIKGVKEVVNNCSVAPPPPPVEIAADDPLTKSVADAVKDYQGVVATVKDGMITLTGEVSKDKLQKLMMALQALKPKKVDASALVKK
jgi:osmotically-inducible protein OsmY